MRSLASVSCGLRGLRGRANLGYRLYKSQPGDWAVRMQRGHRMVLPMSSLQTWEAAFTGCYDEAEVDLILTHARPETTVLDIGACFGLYTVPLAIEGCKRGFRVAAFEPVRNNLRYLEKNLCLNNTAPQIERVVLGRDDGSVSLSVEDGGVGNAAVGTLREAKNLGAGTVTEDASMARLDSYLDLSPCSVIKIDVEGYELEVLAGAERFIEHNRPVIIGEFSADWFTARGVEPDSLDKWAADVGYRVERLDRQRIARWSDRYRLVPGSGTACTLLEPR